MVDSEFAVIFEEIGDAFVFVFPHRDQDAIVCLDAAGVILHRPKMICRSAGPTFQLLDARMPEEREMFGESLLDHEWMK